MKNIAILASIFIIGIVLRFYQLGVIPHSLNWDEVSIGYNAYSILLTGKDEYGEFLPLSFRSFGDYKQPGYIYLTVPFVKLLGLTPLAVRFSSALFGSLSILFVFFIVSEIFYTAKKRRAFVYTATFLFAISPWSIQFSRFASEANVALAFTLAGVWLALRGTRINSLPTLLISLFFFLLSMYTYHSHKLFTPFLMFAILWFRREYFLRNRKLLGLLISLFLLGNLFWVVNMNTTERGRSVLLTSEQTQLLEQPAKYMIEDKEHGDLFGMVTHNRRLVYVETYLKNYLSHFDPNFLFMAGDNARHHAPDMGVVYLVSLPFIILGLLHLWSSYRKEAIFLSLWLIGAPAVSALAINAPSAIRSMMFLPLWQIFAAIGIVFVISLLKKPLIRQGVIIILILAYSGNIIYYLHQYFVHTNKEYAKYWQSGYREAIEYVLPRTSAMPVVFASNMEQGQTFYLFYSKKNPRDYLSTGSSGARKGTCHMIDAAYFGDCLSNVKKGFFVTSTPISEIKGKVEKRIQYPNGEEAVIIYSFEKKD